MGRAKVIALLTDFGLEDPYVGQMKAVIVGINPQVQVIDISHYIPPQDIQEGAFVLYSAYRYFPEGTVFVAVVDPGVGTRRRIICVRTNQHTFLAPDNGLLSFITAREKVHLAVEVTNSRYFLPQVSSTFHGRDIFAPVAAHLSKGLNPTKLGGQIDDLHTFPTPGQIIKEKGLLEAEIIHIDRFGNLITTVEHTWAEVLYSRLISISIKDREITRISRIYQEGQAGELLALFGSSGHLEISVNMGNAREVLGCTRGDKVIVQYQAPETVE
ncbi:MAG TPA: SAM hydrolase/SAM-dependent halogenase family protein [Candidatus Hypogeohydataceae bacterium YC41]